jgi:predicted ArsR family transcriptional regulator
MTKDAAGGPEKDLPQGELSQRVIFSLLQPVVGLAADFGIPIKDLQSWLQVVYLKRLRSKGKTLKEAAELMRVSERTAKRMSQQLKLSFLKSETEHNLPVRIEFMLRASPMSAARLAQVIRDFPAKDVHAAIEQLLTEGTIKAERGRTTKYWVVKSVNSRVRDTWLTRIGALNSLMDNLSDTVRSRFFADEPNAFARTLTFHVAPEEVEEIQRGFEELVERITALNEAAQGQESAIPLRMSVILSPYSDQ